MRRLVILFILLSLPGLAQAGRMVKVKVQRSTIFEEPRFFSKALVSVEYGDELEVLDEQRDWVQVEFQGEEGWIHQSSLTSAKFSLGKILGGSSSAASQDEVALAGKGFNPEVERGYQESHPEINYALVDEIESYNVENESLYEFIRQGGLRIAEAE